MISPFFYPTNPILCKYHVKNRAYAEMINYIKTKKEKIDICNICGQKKRLTWDHVPPKSSVINPSVYANTLFNDLPTESKYMKAYQSGIKFRTICEHCNNVVLGKNDSEYKAFIDEIIKKIAAVSLSQAYDPKSGQCFEVPCKINRVLRAVCGHFLAEKEEYDDKVLSDVYMREYVLNESVKLQKAKMMHSGG